MLATIIRRLLWLPVLLVILTIITLALARYGPGDPVQVMLGPRAPKEAADALREQLGLNEPFPVYAANYIIKAAQGDFGESFKFRGQPVGELIFGRWKVSVQLALTSLLIGTVIGVTLGTLAGLYRNSWLDNIVVAIVVILDSIPTFAITLPLLYLVAVRWRILPPGGWGGLLDARAILPVLILSIGPVATFTRQTRANLLDVMSQDYIRTARAKGLSERRTLRDHALRNAMIPVLTILGLQFTFLLAGGIIIENVFYLPGLGRLVFQAIAQRDLIVVQGVVIVLVFAAVLVTLAVDAAYALADPRVGKGRR